MLSKITGWLAVELPKYWKTVFAVLPAVLYVGNEVVGQLGLLGQDGSITLSDLVKLAILAGTAYGVYKKQNAPLNG